MNKIKFFAIALAGIMGSNINSQELIESNNKLSYFALNKENTVISSLNKGNENKLSLGASSKTFLDEEEEENKSDRGKLYFKEAFLQGSIKTGIRYFVTQSVVSGAEVVLFEDSEVFNSSFNFFRGTNTPSIAVQAEYMVLDAIGVGGFVGAFGSTGSATNSSNVTTDNEIFGTVFGGFVSRVQPIENFLYSGMELFGSYETGVLKTRESDRRSEDYNFNRLNVGLSLSAIFVPSERIQISLGGVGVGYNSFVFTGSGENTVTTTDDNNIDTTKKVFIDNKVKGSEFGIQASPTISILFTVFSPGGR